jgi:hypothetical protein
MGVMPLTIYAIAKLRWTDKDGGDQMRQGNAAIMAKRLEKLRRPASLTLLDGTVIGGCERAPRGKRIKWAWWYDKDALIVGTEETRQEQATRELRERGVL